MKQRIWIVPTALVFGVWLSVAYVNPYGGSLSLSYLVLQLSGARGDFPLGLNLMELISFTLRLVPSLVFQAYAGTILYRHYCTASVYIFSRIPRRLRWYGREATALALQTLLYHAIMLAAVLATAAVRCHLMPDGRGWLLLLFHLLIWSFWSFAFTMGINLLAIYWGSGGAFVILSAFQVVCASLLIVLRAFEENGTALSVLKRVNPITCLILCWQTIRLSSYSGGIYLEDSLSLVLSLAAAVTVAGALVVKRHDLLISDMEGG